MSPTTPRLPDASAAPADVPVVLLPPDTCEQAFAFVHSLPGHPNSLLLNPGRDRVRLFEELCPAEDARGDLVNDACLAAAVASV
jgi:hypothetical protein